MSQPHFIWSYLPFWIVNYGLAVVLWSCIGRFLLSFFVPSLQPGNYIWRAFRVLTEWAVQATRFITPSLVAPVFLAPIAAFWLYHLRVVLFLVMWQAGMTPSITPTPSD
jgi:hypothetical protein